MTPYLAPKKSVQDRTFSKGFQCLYSQLNTHSVALSDIRRNRGTPEAAEAQPHPT